MGVGSLRFKVSGLGVLGSGFGFWVLGFGFRGLGFGVWGLRFGVWDLRFRIWDLGTFHPTQPEDSVASKFREDFRMRVHLIHRFGFSGRFRDEG